jgi:type II restriction enzyme
MPLTPKQQQEILAALNALSPMQVARFESLLSAFTKPVTSQLVNASTLVTQKVVDEMSVRLVAHHASTTQPMTKTIFEHAFNDALNAAGITSALHKSGTNRGHDMTANGVPISLKTEAAAAIKPGAIHVSKWMELGQGAWHLPSLLQHYMTHLNGYDQIFTLRCLSRTPYTYELVEIPKALMLKGANAELVEMTSSKQNPKPGYGYVRDDDGNLLFELYFDGGSERKLQIKKLLKSLCVVRATWSF